MRWIRSLIYGLPILLAVLAIASLISVKLVPATAKNELIDGSLGDATMLNPILSTDLAAANLEVFIFNGLVKYGPNLKLVGDLAKSWEQKQITTFFFKTPEAAQQAEQIIEAQRAKWKGWTLASLDAKGNVLLLNFSEPGKIQSDKIAKLLDTKTIEPLTVIHISVKNSARETLAKFRKSSPLANRIKRVWGTGDTVLELTCAGDSKPLADALRNFYNTQPSLMAKITVAPDGLMLDEPEIIFHLRKNVRWQDGKPFTSKDVAFTFHALMDPKVASPDEADFERVQKLETPDAYTVVVTYRKPYSPALLSWSMQMLPAHILKGKSQSWWSSNFNRSPIGTGPFKFSEWKSGNYIKLVRNDDYFEGKPHLDAIVMRDIPDPVSLRLAFETKQLDFWQVDPWAIGGAKKNPDYKLFASTVPQYDYIGWNLRKPMFKDKRVRRALAYAVNIKAMIKYLLYGYGTQSTGIYPSQMPFANHHITPIPYNPEKAKQLLAEAGWKPGPDGILEKDGQRFSFDLITNQGNELRKDIATLVQADLKKVGIQVNVQIYEWTVFLTHVMKQNYDATVLAWSLGFNYDEYQIWSSTQTHPGQLNAGGYANPEADRLMEKIRTEYDPEQIKKDCAKLQKVIYDDQPYLFLMVPESINATWKGSFRVDRPAGNGKWINEPIKPTKAGFNYYEPWFYRPAYTPQLKP